MAATLHLTLTAACAVGALTIHGGPVAQSPTTPPTTDTEAEAAGLSADAAAFRRWFADYTAGAARLVAEQVVDQKAVARVRKLLQALTRHGGLAAAELAFEAAIVDPSPPGARSPTARIEFHAELLPWRVRAMAREEIAAMPSPEVESWLIKILHDRALRAKDDDGDVARTRADAALQTLGLRASKTAKQALLEASSRLPAGLRTRALDVLSDHADLSVLPHFIDRLRDKDPRMRITALNAIGNALGPHTDETEHESIPNDVAKQRSTVLDGLTNILKRDKVWQVRAAAVKAAVTLRTKLAIPLLIKGLEAELKRKKDPWAMDVRIHRALEQLTGHAVPVGDTRGWQAFWRAEKDRFRLAKPGDGSKQQARSDGEKYEKFFSLSLDSDRVLFIVDFSGSMEEPITLDTETTTTKPGETLQKAKLVVREMKRIILSLQDGARFNVVVFNDEVRVWRPDADGRPLAVALDDETRDDLLGTFLDSLAPHGPTNLHGAFDRAFDFDGSPSKLGDKRYGAGFDTIYVLSDGAPTSGEVQDKVEIRKLVKNANRVQQITIHCVTFGELNDVEFLRDLAEENGGRHIHVE